MPAPAPPPPVVTSFTCPSNTVEQSRRRDKAYLSSEFHMNLCHE